MKIYVVFLGWICLLLCVRGLYVLDVIKIGYMLIAHKQIFNSQLFKIYWLL